MKLLFLIISLFWVLVVVAFLYWAPVVSFLNLLVLAVIIMFIKSEGSSWHHAQEFENRFWTVISFITAAVLMFSPDSPVGIGRWSIALGWTIVVIVSFAVHSYDRHLHRVNISRKPEFVRSRRGGSSVSAHMRGGLSPNSIPNTVVSPPQHTPDVTARVPLFLARDFSEVGVSSDLPTNSLRPSKTHFCQFSFELNIPFLSVVHVLYNRPRAISNSGSAMGGGTTTASGIGTEGDSVSTRTQRSLSFSSGGNGSAGNGTVKSPTQAAGGATSAASLSSSISSSISMSGVGGSSASSKAAGTGYAANGGTTTAAGISTNSGASSSSDSTVATSTNGSRPVSPTAPTQTRLLGLLLEGGSKSYYILCLSRRSLLSVLTHMDAPFDSIVTNAS